MADMNEPLTRTRSLATGPPTVSETLPTEVVTCLQNARFLHLATCTNNVPHVSLMNYTYLPSTPFPSTSRLPSGPIILMTSPPSSKKTANLLVNPHVSVLVHDWVSSRPPNSVSSAGHERERSPTGGPRSSLAAMLMQMNSTAVSSISATINGEADVLEVGSEEERWCREQHLMNNTFVEGSSGQMGRSTAAEEGDEGRVAYIEDDEARVVVVKVRDGRVSDWKGDVKDWFIRRAGENDGSAIAGEERLANGI